MKKKYEGGDSSLTPTGGVFVTRLQGWSKAGNPEMTAAVLREWISNVDVVAQTPGTQEFNAVLQAWHRSRRENSAQKAEDGLAEMTQMAATQKYDCHPDVFSYTILISIYADSGLLCRCKFHIYRCGSYYI